MSNLVKISIGDWSDDGHGKYEDFYFEVPDQFTKEILNENYVKNKEKFGFGLSDFAENYEDSTIPNKFLDILWEAGLDKESVEVDADDTDGTSTIFPSSMFEITMFMIGHGLEGFTYEVKELKEDFNMFSWWSATEESGIGYGLFY